MKCPVCDRSLAPTLSICPSCGAMMNDTVREVLESRITPTVPQRLVPRAMPPAVEATPPATPPAPRLGPRIVAEPPVKRIQTANLVAPKTSPTLVGFKSKNAPLPEWRLQMQNAVQKRKGGEAAASAPSQLRVEEPSGADSEPTERQPKIADRRVENAMKRIAESRAAFLKPPAVKKPSKQTPRQVPNPVQKQFPFDVVPSQTPESSMAAPPPIAAAQPKPQIVNPVNPPPVLVEKRDTNKLPPIETVVADQVIKKVEPLDIIEERKVVAEFTDIKRIRIRVEDPEVATDIDSPGGEIEDLAPFSMRFGAGLFDLIIGAFGGLLLISPVAFSTDNWFTTTGILTFTGAWALFLFIYMTACLGFYGKTTGMRLFSLELVDAIENEYPTLRQAAVNSSVFIVSLPLAGVGFITAIFNEEHRALHDLLSGTIQVREF